MPARGHGGAAPVQLGDAGPGRRGVAAIIEQNTFRSFEVYIVVTVIYLALALALKTFLLALGKRLFPNTSGLARIEAKGSAV